MKCFSSNTILTIDVPRFYNHLIRLPYEISDFEFRISKNEYFEIFRNANMTILIFLAKIVLKMQENGTNFKNLSPIGTTGFLIRIYGLVS